MVVEYIHVCTFIDTVDTLPRDQSTLLVVVVVVLLLLLLLL